MDCAEARARLSRRVDGELRAGEATALDAHLSACGACRALGGDWGAEAATVAALWAPAAAPPDFAARVTGALPARPAAEHGHPSQPPLGEARSPHPLGVRESPPATTPPRRSVARARRGWLAAAALLALLLVGSAVAGPTARAGLGLFLRQVVLRESRPPPEPSRTLPMERLSLEEARRLVPWPIRLPTRLPDGYRLADVYAADLHTFAVGPTVVLHYQQGDGPAARHLGLTQLRTAADVPEEVEPGAARVVPIGERQGLFVDGRWVERDDRRAWERGTMVRLIVEDGDLVVQLQADPRDGWDWERLADVAASLR